MSEVTLDTQTESVDVKLTKSAAKEAVPSSQRSWKDTLLFSWAYDFIDVSFCRLIAQ